MTARRTAAPLAPRASAPLALLAAAVLALLALATPAAAQRTTESTIGDRNGDDRLERGPGEGRVVRADLGRARSDRARRRRAKAFFGQLTDTHVVDEESPLRVEFLDRFGDPFTSAYRPQEGLSPQVADQMVRQIRAARSPVTGGKLQFVMTTGDNTDNSQQNETRWFIDLLDGRRINPDSGVPGTCGAPRDGLYDGVRDDNEFYEPDRSGPAGANVVDGPGYSPDRAENQSENGLPRTLRDFPGLYEDQNRPFDTAGLGLPWYGIFGNHDGLIQGNQPRSMVFENIAVGCNKIQGLSPAAVTEIQALAAGGVTQDELRQINGVVFRDIGTFLSSPLAFGGRTAVVPSDPARRPLKKSEYIQEHFSTTGAPDGHGFTRANVTSGQGNFTIRPRAGLRFIVLDSINEGGGDGGNLDDDQFRWLHSQLLAAERRRELVLVFAHHSLQTMNQGADSPFPRGDQGGNESRDVHFGLGPGETTVSCPTSRRTATPREDETVRCLFLRHPSVISFVNGHEHNNRVDPFPRRPGAGTSDGGFWEVNTASHIDWPQQSRVLDVVDNCDGNLSIFGTVIDHGGAPDPGASGAAGRSPANLASISRELAFNDPDAQTGEGSGGTGEGGAGSEGEGSESDSAGTAADRNVELVVRNPYPVSANRACARGSQRGRIAPRFTG